MNLLLQFCVYLFLSLKPTFNNNNPNQAMKNLINEIVALNFRYLQQNEQLAKLLDLHAANKSAAKSEADPEKLIENTAKLHRNADRKQEADCRLETMSRKSKERDCHNYSKDSKMLGYSSASLSTKKKFYEKKPQAKLLFQLEKQASKCSKPMKLVKKNSIKNAVSPRQLKNKRQNNEDATRGMALSPKIPKVSTNWLFGLSL